MRFLLSALTLASGALALSPTAPQDAYSCVRAAPKLSCTTDPVVDPTSFGTCCYNGALQAGSKESGLVLATQFWTSNSHVGQGPNNSFTIHGLWPDYCDGSYPQYCTKDSGIPEFNGAQIKAQLAQYAPSTLNYMNTYYKDISGDDASFWDHEYNKHGTCFSTLRAKCQIPTRGMNQTSAALVGYFEEIVRQFKRLPTYDWLASASILPSSTTTYPLASIQNVLTSKHGGVPYIGCNKNGTSLSEVWYYYHTRVPKLL
ncbi:Ribonuclease, T2 family [Ceraceosorus bombacis]|uniref:ribonuclease T2 n=1 Tax=Ceraceosorus bombacis TaxID=401625 RepID=A0A0P1B9X8_9BASI|nr:Ribonuclease, T2 family [Ceraceosorus bombacis]